MLYFMQSIPMLTMFKYVPVRTYKYCTYTQCLLFSYVLYSMSLHNFHFIVETDMFHNKVNSNPLLQGFEP